VKKVTIILLLILNYVFPQSAGDYRSKTSGNWNATSSWERFDGSSWVDPTSTPTSSDGVITIRNGHTITITASVTYDQVVVESGAQVTVNSGVTHTLNNGTGTDLSISGTWLNSGGTWTINTGATWRVENGGTFIHNTTAGIATPLNSATLDNGSNFIYRGSGTLTPSVSMSGRTYGNLSFESVSGTWTASVSGSATLTINGNFLIGTGVTYSTTQTGTMTFAGNFTNNGTLTNSTGTQVYTFTGVDKTIGGSGTIEFETLNIASGASITLNSNISIASSFTATVNGILDVNTRTVSGGGNFTLSSGGTTKSAHTSGLNGNITVTGTKSFSTGANYEFNGTAAQVTGSFLPSTVNNLTINNAAGVTLSGNVTVNGTLAMTSVSLNLSSYTLSYGSSATLLYNGTSSQTTGSELLSSIPNLTINNPAGVNLNSSTEVNNSLTLTNGLFNIGSNNLTLGSSATIGGSPSASNMIVATGSGEVRKLFTGTGTFTFPVGDNTGSAEYSPATLNFTSGSFGTGAYAAVRLVDAKHPNNTSSSDYITRYWIVISTGITSFSCNASFLYTDDDINGDETQIYLGRYKDGSWTLFDLTNVSTNTLSGTVTSFSDFTGGESGALPVNLLSLTANVLKDGVQLNWATATETNNYGFEIERKVQNSDENWKKIGFVGGGGTSNSPKSYKFTDNSPVVGKNYYRLKQVDTDGSISYSNIVEVEYHTSIPNQFSLSQNYPNPFNPTTTIRYELAKGSDVKIVVYNINGELVKELVNQRQEAGIYEVEFQSVVDGKQLANGVYFYKLQAGDFTEVRKMILMK
jgi:hypothetical protein